jgi:uncharacterized protein YqeY
MPAWRNHGYNEFMPTKQELEADLKDALRSGDDLRKRTLRMLLSNIKLAEVEARRPLDESEVLGAIQKEVKTRNESVEEARQYKREDLAKAAQDEIDFLQAYLPEPLSEAELQQLAQDVITDVGAASPGDMGRVMKALMPRIQGRADGKTASQIVRDLLGS